MALLVSLAAAGVEAQVEAPGFLVVVNTDNPTTKLAKDEVAKMFRKQILRWPGWEGEPRIEPVDQRANAPVRESFTREVHGWSQQRLQSYWHRKIFSGDAVPPPTRETDAAVLEFVRQSPGAIGYVSAGTPLGRGVRALVLAD